MMGVGATLMYAGIKGYSLMAVIQNLVSGKPIHENVTMLAPLGNEEIASGIGTADTSGIGVASGSPREIGKAAAVLYGWTVESGDWDALDKLWTRESGWNPKAENKKSGAFGIPQALPYSKMPKAAWPTRFGGQADAGIQIGWGLGYIKNRYGSPRMAWAHEQANGWY
jgi:hypothetical protein